MFKLILIRVLFFAGQLPPVPFICCIISFLWLLNFLHLNIKWSTVRSSSSHGHIGLSVCPNLCQYELIFPGPVSIVVNAGNTGILCISLLLTDGKKAFVTAPFPYPPTAVHTYEVHCFFSCYNHLSWRMSVYIATRLSLFCPSFSSSNFPKNFKIVICSA